MPGWTTRREPSAWRSSTTAPARENVRSPSEVESMASRPADAPTDSWVAAPSAVRQRPLADTAWVRWRLSENAGRVQS